MQPTDDGALLRQYAQNQSDEAFAALVTRHVNLVYSVALRQLGDPHHAEEVTQAVFVILAKKAARLRHEKALSSWLFQVTRLTANNFLRSEIRRHRREQEAHMQTVLNESGSDAWPGIAPLLDAAVAGLGEKDRRAILLRFYEGRNLREVGLALGASEDAAEKRVGRAVEKLRRFFTKRGVAMSAAVLTAAISAHSVQAAPSVLAKTATAVAITKGATASSSTLTLIKGALKIMAWTKAKTAVVVGVGILLSAGTATVVVREMRQPLSWQIPNWDSGVLDRQPPQVRILSSKVPYGSWGNSGDKRMGTGVTVGRVVMAAYEWYDGTRTVASFQEPATRYDFIATLPNGNAEALQREVKRKFGITAKKEMIETNVFVMKVKYANAPGLKPGGQDANGSSTTSNVGHLTFKNIHLGTVAANLEEFVRLPILDQTGLTNRYDIDLAWKQKDWNDTNIARLNQSLIDQLGLELVPGRETIEMLVVRKD